MQQRTSFQKYWHVDEQNSRAERRTSSYVLRGIHMGGTFENCVSITADASKLPLSEALIACLLQGRSRNFNLES
jgi:hypothetical protein